MSCPCQEQQTLRENCGQHLFCKLVLQFKIKLLFVVDWFISILIIPESGWSLGGALLYRSPVACVAGVKRGGGGEGKKKEGSGLGGSGRGEGKKKEGSGLPSPPPSIFPGLSPSPCLTSAT